MTNVDIIVNKINADHNYQDNPADFVIIDLTNDYLVWSEGSSEIADGKDEPTENELNSASPIIDPTLSKTVSKCFIFDKSDGGGLLRLLNGMGINKRFTFGFSFDGATASEPQLEVWDNTDHDSTAFHVLGNGTPANSMIKGVCTTIALPGESWVGNPLAGATVLLLNNGSGALNELETLVDSQELYCNLKIVIPAAYATPAVEPFVLSLRYMWN